MFLAHSAMTRLIAFVFIRVKYDYDKSYLQIALSVEYLLPMKFGLRLSIKILKIIDPRPIS